MALAMAQKVGAAVRIRYAVEAVVGWHLFGFAQGYGHMPPFVPSRSLAYPWLRVKSSAKPGVLAKLQCTVDLHAQARPFAVLLSRMFGHAS